MEKIKDFLYDISDIVVSLLIIAAIFSIVTWKISTSLDIPEINIAKTNNNLVLDNTTVTEDNNLIDIITVDNSNEVANNNSSSSIETDELVENNTDTSSSTLDAKPDPSSTDNTLDSSTSSEIVKINIKSGTSGYGIAKILESEDLIDDTTVFIKRVEELSLGMSLRAGDFTLKTDMTLDEMIYVLAGK